MVQRLAEKMHKLDFDDEVTGLIYGHAFRSGEPPARLNSQQVCRPTGRCRPATVLSGCTSISTTRRRSG